MKKENTIQSATIHQRFIPLCLMLFYWIKALSGCLMHQIRRKLEEYYPQ